MTRPQRTTHAIAWTLLAPALLLALVIVLRARPEPPTPTPTPTPLVTPEAPR